MNIAIVGYGKMGREVEGLIREGGKHTVVSIACRKVGDELTPDALKEADVAIDFSHGDLIRRHIELYCQSGVSAVIGTTGWDTHDAELIAKADAAGIGVVVGSNFSAGLQIFLQAVRDTAERLHSVGGYDVYVHEVHHRHKADSPSGTAKTVAEVLLNAFPSKTSIMTDPPAGQIDESTLLVSSVRSGVNPGLHTVVFDGDADTLTLTHAAHNRRGFAAGAIAATEYAASHAGWTRYEQLFEKESI